MRIRLCYIEMHEAPGRGAANRPVWIMLKFIFAAWAAAFVLLFAGPSARADEIACRPSGHSPSTTGVVLLHGTLEPSYWLMPLKKKLDAAGFRTAMPEMPWSTKREYDRTYEEALDEVAAAAGGLERHGARRIVVAGHSMGGNAALAYAALRGGIAGLIVISPGPFPEDPDDQKEIAPGMAKARQMIAAGQGGQMGVFKDFVQWHGSMEGAHTTAKNYFSYYDPDGNAVIPKNAARMKPGIAVLWLLGMEEKPNRVTDRSYAFDKLPPNRLNRYILVPKGHLDAPATGADSIVAWLKCL